MLPDVNGSRGSGKWGCSWGGCAFCKASISSIQCESGGGTAGMGASGATGTSGVGGVSADRVAVERVLALRSFGVASASSVEG